MSVSSISSSASNVDFAELRKQMAQRMAERMMKDLDADGDGKLSKNELLQASQAHASSSSNDTSSGKSIDDLFAALDSDGDGSVSKSELSEFMEKAGPSGPPPAGGPPPGPPPGGENQASSSSSSESDATTGETDATITLQQRMAFAYQQLMAALERLGGAATDGSGTSTRA
jgi:Ca2+-binding EF-hand superfamily protein